jgi:hypothetical protein
VFGIVHASIIEQWYPSLGGRLIPVTQPCLESGPTPTSLHLWHLHIYLAPIVSEDYCFVAEGELSRAVITAKGKTTPHLLMDSRPNPKPVLPLDHPYRTHRHVFHMVPTGFRVRWLQNAIVVD